MKITVTVDCTPEEARTFFGFPNMDKLQEQVLAEMQKRVTSGLSGAEMEKLFELWMPNKNWQNFQSMFWPGTGSPDKTDKP